MKNVQYLKYLLITSKCFCSRNSLNSPLGVTRVYTSFGSKRFAKHLGHMYFRVRLVRNFEAYVRAKAKQRRKQPALFLLSHCNNNGDVFYVAQTASTLAQGWRRNESCCETVVAMIQGSSSLFFYGFSSSGFHFAVSTNTSCFFHGSPVIVLFHLRDLHASLTLYATDPGNAVAFLRAASFLRQQIKCDGWIFVSVVLLSARRILKRRLHSSSQITGVILRVSNMTYEYF